MIAFSSGCGSLRLIPAPRGGGVPSGPGGERDALMERRHRALMRDDVARVQLDLQLVPRLANLHAAPDPGDRHRVANGVHRGVSFHVHRARM